MVVFRSTLCSTGTGTVDGLNWLMNQSVLAVLPVCTGGTVAHTQLECSSCARRSIAVRPICVVWTRSVVRAFWLSNEQLGVAQAVARLTPPARVLTLS